MSLCICCSKTLRKVIIFEAHSSWWRGGIILSALDHRLEDQRFSQLTGKLTHHRLSLPKITEHRAKCQLQDGGGGGGGGGGAGKGLEGNPVNSVMRVSMGVKL